MNPQHTVYNVVLSLNGQEVSTRSHDTYKEAYKEFKRQANNAWRRKSAFSQVEHHEFLASMSWYQKEGHYYLEMTSHYE